MVVVTLKESGLGLVGLGQAVVGFSDGEL